MINRVMAASKSVIGYLHFEPDSGRADGFAAQSPVWPAGAGGIDPNVSGLIPVSAAGGSVNPAPQVAHPTGKQVLLDALKYMGFPFRNYNCVGFAYTVGHDMGASFFDPKHTQSQWVGPRGADNAGPLLNMNNAVGKDNPNFLTPIGGTPQHPILYPDVAGDGWHLVGAHNNATVISTSDPSSTPQPGDELRAVIMGKNHQLVLHSGIVANYNPATHMLGLVSNWVSDSASKGGALISIDNFHIGLEGLGVSRDIVGPMAIYRIDT